jgi:hypothetical protein
VSSASLFHLISLSSIVANSFPLFNKVTCVESLIKCSYNYKALKIDFYTQGLFDGFKHDNYFCMMNKEAQAQSKELIIAFLNRNKGYFLYITIL